MIVSNRVRLVSVTCAAFAAAGGVTLVALGQQQPPAPPQPPLIELHRPVERVELPTTRPASTQPAGMPMAPTPFYVIGPDGTPRPVYSAGVGGPRFDYGTSGIRPGAPAPAVDPAEVAQQASCVLQIDYDGGFPSSSYSAAGGIDPQTVVGLLNSSAVIDAAVKASLNLDPQQQREGIVVNAYTTGPRFARVEIIFRRGRLPDGQKPDAAATLLREVVERLRATVKESVEAQRKVTDERRAANEAAAAEVRAKLKDVQDRVRDARRQTQAAGVNSYGDPHSAAQNLRSQRKQAETELARQRARLAELEPETSPLLAELQEVAQMRQQQLDDARKRLEKKEATPAEVAEREAKVREVTARLEAQRRAAAGAVRRSSSGTDTASLRNVIADAEERVKTLNEQLAMLEDKKFLDLAEQLPELQQEEQRLRNQMAELTNRQDYAGRRGGAPADVRITVLDGTPD